MTVDAGWFRMEAKDFTRMRKAQKTSWLVKVQKGGRITLPKALMKQMGWKVGDILLIRGTNDGGILLTKKES